jgi:hypothetical protein
VAIVRMCYEAKKYDLLNEHIVSANKETWSAEAGSYSEHSETYIFVH